MNRNDARFDGGFMSQSHSDNVVRRELLGPPGPYVAPRTELEGRLAEIWRDVLNMDRVGVEDAFNDLGADSVLAAIIFAEIEETFGITIPMATLLVAPTIARLARRVDELVSAREAQA